MIERKFEVIQANRPSDFKNTYIPPKNILCLPLEFLKKTRTSENQFKQRCSKNLIEFLSLHDRSVSTTCSNVYLETTYNHLNFRTHLSADRSASFSARPKGDMQFQRPAQSSSSTSQLQSQGDSSQSDFHHQGSSSTITSSIGGSSGVIAGSQGADVGDHHTPTEGKRGKQKTAQPNARSESYKECSPKRSRTNRPKSDPSLYE